MVPTIQITDSDGTVLAPIGNSSFVPTRRRDVLIVRPSPDEDLPLHIREALVGMVISTIFGPGQLNGKVPPGGRVAYGADVVEALTEAGKIDIAQELATALTTIDPDGEYQYVLFRAEEYRLVEELASPTLM